MKLSTSITGLLLLAACGATTTQTRTMSFDEAQKVCFDQTVAGVETKKGEVVRASIGIDGGFRGGIFRDGFQRGDISGAPYDACMADKLGAIARSDRIAVTDGILLTLDEKFTWDQMTPEERERVRLFMLNGGTFASAAGSGA